MITPHDVERYLSSFRAMQSIDARHEDFHRWIRQLCARGL